MHYLLEFLTVSLILFSVIDIVGSLPIVVDLKNRAGQLKTRQATLSAGLLMVVFLFAGEGILHLFGTDVASFAIAGALVILAMGVEMILDIHLFKQRPDETSTASIVPLAFPLIAGAGTLSTILTLKTAYSQWSILAAIVINLAIVFGVLQSSNWIEQRLGRNGLSVLRKVFGILLLSIAVKLIRSHLAG